MIKDLSDRGKKDLYGRLVEVAKKRTAVADTVMDDRGKKVEEDFGDNVLIIGAETDHGEETGETDQG
jgi:hypothetical protein